MEASPTQTSFLPDPMLCFSKPLHCDTLECTPKDEDLPFSMGMGFTAIVADVYGVDRPFVLKVPHDEDQRECMEREVEIFNRLGSHPSIIGFYGTTKDERGLISLKLERADHSSIPTFWGFYHLSPVHLRFRWILQIADALEYIHSKGVIHGNLAPSNILVMESLDAKLCDFGGSGIDGSGLLAWGMPPFYRLVDREDCTKAVQFNEQDDIFAFGTLMLSIMDANVPYKELDPDEVNSLYADSTAIQHPPITDTVDPRLSSVIRACWEGEYSDAKALLCAWREVEARLIEDPLLGYNPEDGEVAAIERPSGEHYFMDRTRIVPMTDNPEDDGTTEYINLQVEE